LKGSVIKRGSTWTAYWSTKDAATGKRDQHSKGGFKTKKAGQAHLNVVLVRVEDGTWNPESKLTVKDFVEKEWLPSIKAAVMGGSLKPTTEAAYRHLMTRHVVPRIGAIRLADLTAVRLNALYDDLLTSGRMNGTGLSSTSVHFVHVAVHRMLKDGGKWGHLQRNVADHATRPRPATRPMTPWSPNDTRTFIRATTEERMGALWWVLAMTGLRRGEACGLRWSDIDLDTHRLTVARARVMAGGKVVLSSPKTAKSARTIGLDASTVVTLRAHKARQSRDRLAAGPAWSCEDDWVFTNELGEPLHPNTVSKLFTKAVSNAGVPKIRLHDLRHGYATAALEAGASLKVVSERLGHSKTAITADIYSHVRPEVDQAVADEVAELILGSEAG
jgi:integrase